MSIFAPSGAVAAGTILVVAAGTILVVCLFKFIQSGVSDEQA
jgi:hypothetical protein